ncbi:MAG: hypothetical protein J5654_10775 [Victivallales bacterium]|nr:hypothetical protein [Victivallales bacterium]
MPDEATVLRTSGCPAIDGSKGFLSAVSPGALRRPLRVRRLHRHGQKTVRAAWHLRGTK